MNIPPIHPDRRIRSTRMRVFAVLLSSGVLALGTIVYSGCQVLLLPAAPVVIVADKLAEERQRAGRRRLPVVPESEWNLHGLWERVGSAPATYIPKGYGRNSPRGEGAGTSFVDQRDGKRLFVPNRAVGEVRPGVFRGEAIRITNWESGGSMPGVQELPMERVTLP